MKTVRYAKSESEIEHCFTVMKELRPHLQAQSFVAKISGMMQKGYILAYIDSEEGEAVCAAGFRFSELLHWGNSIYIDDLSTMPYARGKGYASTMLDHIKALALENKCEQIHLDSGCNPTRFNAHRLYLNKGFNITSLHFAMVLKES